MLKQPDGIKYYGEWKKSMVNGEGAVVDADGELIGEGTFVNYWMKYKGK